MNSGTHLWKLPKAERNTIRRRIRFIHERIKDCDSKINNAKHTVNIYTSKKTEFENELTTLSKILL